MLKKVLLSFCSLTVIAPSSFTLFNKNQTDEWILKQIQEDISQNSQLIKSEYQYEFDGKTYRDKQSIINEHLINNPITVDQTVSNPNKIIKNYATNELDDNKIYQNNSPNNMIKVYENALGKAVLPSCKELNIEGCVSSNLTQLDRAYNSFINKGLFTPAYSYDGINWFESPEEAKSAFEISTFDYSQSLFYLFEGKYYNAFNENDMQILLNQQRLFKSGYRYNPEEYVVEDNTTLPPFKNSFSYDKTDFISYFSQNLKQHLLKEKNIDDIFTLNNEYAITLKAPNNDYHKEFFKIYKSAWPDFDFIGEPSYINGEFMGYEEVTLIFKNEAASYFKYNYLIKQLKNIENWKLTDPETQCTNSNNWKKSRVFELDKYGSIYMDVPFPPCKKNKTWTPNPNKADYSFPSENNGQTNISIKSNSINSLWKSLNNNFNINLDMKTIFQSLIQSSGEEIIYFSQWNKISNMDYLDKNIFLDLIVNEVKKYIFKENMQSNNIITNDYVYGNTTVGMDQIKKYDFSLLESQQRFDNSFEKTAVIDEDNRATFIWQEINFTEAVEKWKQFTPLENDKLNSGIELVHRYLVDSKDNPAAQPIDITSYSDLLGTNLGENLSDVRDIIFNNSLGIMRKSYFVYDINGNEKQIFADTKDEAAKILRKEIQLENRVIHKDEIKNYKDQTVAMNDLISDGLYAIYKFRAVNGNQMYFKDYSSARNIYENQISLIGAINEEFVNYYLYSIVINGETKKYYWDSTTDMQQLSQEIYNETKGGII